jgi:hypothetical protein
LGKFILLTAIVVLVSIPQPQSYYSLLKARDLTCKSDRPIQNAGTDPAA